MWFAAVFSEFHFFRNIQPWSPSGKWPKNQTHRKRLEIRLVYAVFRADSKYHICFNAKDNFHHRKRLANRQKTIKSVLCTGILRIFIGCPSFSLNIFISFCSFLKGLSNEMKISLTQHHSYRGVRQKTIEICTFNVVFRGIQPNSHPYPLFYPYIFTPLNRSRQDLSFYIQTNLARLHSHRSVRHKPIEISTFNIFFHSIQPNSHPYPLFYPYIFTPFDRFRRDLSFEGISNLWEHPKHPTL